MLLLQLTHLRQIGREGNRTRKCDKPAHSAGNISQRLGERVRHPHGSRMVSNPAVDVPRTLRRSVPALGPALRSGLRSLAVRSPPFPAHSYFLEIIDKILAIAIHNTLLYDASMPRIASKLDDSRWESQLRKGSLNLAILAVLWKQRCYGLEIIRELKGVAGMELAEGTLYPVLLRLTQESLVESEWVDANSGHPRKYYRLSKAGRRRAVEMMHAWGEFSAAMGQLVQLMKETAND